MDGSLTGQGSDQCLVLDVPPQPNSQPDSVFDLDGPAQERMDIHFFHANLLKQFIHLQYVNIRNGSFSGQHFCFSIHIYSHLPWIPQYPHQNQRYLQGCSHLECMGVWLQDEHKTLHQTKHNVYSMAYLSSNVTLVTNKQLSGPYSTSKTAFHNVKKRTIILVCFLQWPTKKLPYMQ